MDTTVPYHSVKPQSTHTSHAQTMLDQIVPDTIREEEPDQSLLFFGSNYIIGKRTLYYYHEDELPAILTTHPLLFTKTYMFPLTAYQASR
ncbi:MAG: hypothetical protein NZL83_03390 [Candidatus Absconditabacterales bacterium]|nr:hypothetical protein [Candidatus Absconditabacterales bacterium]